MNTQVADIKKLWEKILKIIKVKINDDRYYSTFLEGSEIYNIDNNTITVVVNTKLAKQVLTSKEYNKILVDSVYDVLESNYNVNVLLKEEINKRFKEENKLIALFSESRIKKEMTFDNFVIGESNKEAFQASLIVSDLDKSLYSANPLFIYSDSGLGKTHLLNAIGNEINIKHPTKRVLYTTAAEFFNEYVHVIKNEREENQLLDYFRKIDVLLIDDIQFFGGKVACEDLFFTIFSSLIANDKRVVITSDKQPSLLKNLESRLVTRFAGGLDVAINPPDVETSIKIVKNYVLNNNVDLDKIDEEVFSFFAQKFSSNIRELRGAVNKLLFYAFNIKNLDRITLSVAIEAVGDFLKVSNKKEKLNEIIIIETVANYYSLTSSQLTGKLRNNQIALARHIAMYLIREMLDLPYIKIGKIFGGKDHSTVMSACEKVEKQLKINPNLQNVISDLKTKIKQ